METQTTAAVEAPRKDSFDFPARLLRGAGQVMFQNNAWTGFFFLIGIFWGGYQEGFGLVAWGALLGLVVSTVTGYLLGLPPTTGPTDYGDSTAYWSAAHSRHSSATRSGCGSHWYSAPPSRHGYARDSTASWHRGKSIRSLSRSYSARGFSCSRPAPCTDCRPSTCPTRRSLLHSPPRAISDSSTGWSGGLKVSRRSF